jgi:prevent-host-death family protein
MKRVTIRELRNRGGEILLRVSKGETLTVTSDGRPIAELRPLPRQPLASATLLSRWRLLAPIDAARLRADIDATLDARL